MQRNEIENVKIPLEAGKQRPVKGKTSSEEGKCETVPEVAETQFGNTVSFQSLSNDVAPKQTSPINSKTNSDSSDATATEPSESQVRIVMNKLPVNDGIKGNIHSNSNRTGTNVPKSSHALKLNSKNVHDKVMKAEDEVFKITDNIRGSRSAQQSLADGDPDNHGLTQTVDNVPEQFKIKNGAQKQHHMLGAEGGLKNIPHSMKGNVAVSSDEKETDGTNGKLENLAKNYIADDEDVSAAFVRNAKHTGHLTPISPRREKSHIHRVDKANAHTSLHPSSLARSNHIKAELEKRRLERFHALAAHRAKLKEDLLKIRAMAAEGKLKLPHHIIRRDTTQDENTESLMSDNVLDDASDHVKLQLPTVTKTEKIKAELEKKRLERLHVLAAQRAKLKEDLLKMKVMATEGKLKLPHHIIRRDTTQDENTESLMSDNVLDDASDHVKLQLPTVTKTEKIKAELEKKRLERLHFLAAQRAKLKEDFLKMKVMATEGKLKLPHHIRRRDTTQDENTEPLMSDTESTEFHPLMSIRNEDRKGYSNRDNPSLGSQNVRETDSDLSSHKQERNDKHFPQDTHSWLEQVFLPVAMVTDQRDVEIPAFDSQQVYKPPHDSETEILARNYVSGSELVHVPNHEGKALVEESKILNSATSPFFMFYDMGPKQKYVESLLQEGQGKERDSGKENVSQETILNSSPDQRGAEDESSQGHYVEIKQLSLPFLISRSVLKKYPMMKQSKNMPISENDIQFIFDLETDEADDDVGELMREQTDMSPILRVAKSDYGRSIMRPEVKDDASLSEKWEEQDAENTRGSLMPVSEETDPNHPITLKVDHLPEELNKTDAGWDKRQENGMNIDGSKYENKKSGGKYFKSSNKIIQSSQSLNDVLDEVNPTTMRTLKTMEDIEKDSAVSKNNMFGKNAHSITLQSVTQDLGTNSELMPGSGNSHIVPIRSKRALAYQFKDKFSDDLLDSSILVNKDNSEIEDNMNGNKYINVIMPGSKALSFSNVTSENNILSDMKKFKYNSDSMPANSLYVRDDKLISDYASKDLKPVSHEKRAADQSHLESLGNYLNDIINVETDDDTGNNKLEDALNEISEDVNLQTNEINRRFRTSDSFVKYKLESNRNNGDNEQNITETKIIPYELHKHVLNSNYAPRHRKIWKYLYLPKNKHLAASSEELPSIEYFNPVNKTGNRSSPSDETSPASKDIFSVILGEFPNISSKSTEISKTSLSNNTTITAEETPKTATELKDVSKFPMSRNVVTNTDTEYVTEPNVKKWNKESSLISETHPKDEFNYPFRSMKSITASEQKPGDLETVTNTKENSGYLVIMDQNTEHIETPKGKKRNDKNQEENKQITTTGHIHKFIKNVADHVVRFFHKLSPWNYFRY
ncbi:hypothetical protein B7P43_G18243 [Cryptotermes secundus]|uniref:Uncharacterized protein n=2 Tax=Cryptotermes secundus TaxID=105785 RepID=A0A2J7PIL2_9NEOP|nr:hypothetical protein B7P43_G18243 [Cryptotermes secundus]